MGWIVSSRCCAVSVRSATCSPFPYSGNTDEVRGGLTTLRLTVEYRGGGFHGFQWQPNLRTVAGVLEAALSRLLGEPVKITGAGRTDSGVHATGQVVSVSTNATFAFDRLNVALNALLPNDCAVRECDVVDGDFSARFSASERTYIYAILNRCERSALLAHYAWHVRHVLDVAAMIEAARHFLGEHDFAAFCTAGVGGEAASTVRNVTRFTVERRGQLLRIETAANAFLHRMVRALVGTLVECGRGLRSPDGMRNILSATDRSAKPVAPAHGLYLAGVRYEDGYNSFLEPPLFAHRNA